MGSIGASKTPTIQQITQDKKVAAAVEKAFNRANLEGEDSDIYNHIYAYKALRNLPQEQIEVIYDYLAERLGF